MGKQKGIIPILIVILIAVLGIGGYFVYTSLREVLSPSKDDVAILPSPTHRIPISPVPEEVIGKELTALKANYTFIQLVEWHKKIGFVWDDQYQTVSTDADEVRNRIVIRVQNPTPSIKKKIEEELTKAGIPLNAVIIEKGAPIEAL